MADALQAPKVIIEMVAVNAKQTVLPYVPVEQITYPALISVSAAVSVRMVRTQIKYETNDNDDGDDV